MANRSLSLAQNQLYADQVVLLYRQAPLAHIITLIAGVVLVLVQRPYSAPPILLGWFSVHLLVTLGRAGLAYAFKRRQPALADISWWGRAYGFGAGLAGLTWGATAVLLFPVESVGHQVFLAFMLGGMAAGAISVMASVRSVALWFLLPTLLPLAVQFFRQTHGFADAMGTMIILYTGAIVATTWTLHRFIRDAMFLVRENQALLSQLATEKTETEQLNSELRTVNAQLRAEIDERQRAEQALHEINETLETQVQARTSELQREIAEREAQQTQLDYLSRHDPLTQLPNRQAFLDRLQYAIHQAQARGDPAQLAVLMLDLNRFKRINENLGHSAGDALLQAVARRLSSSVRDWDTVARLGNDEFAIMLDGISEDAQITAVVNQLLSSLKAPIRISGQDCFVTCGVGISRFPQDSGLAENLITYAASALSRVKSQGQNGYRFYTPAMANSTGAGLLLESDLRQALVSEELVLYYQPQFDLVENKVIGFEALLRWPGGRRGLLSAGPVIALAEESDLIIELGEWVLKTACRQLGAWQTQGLALDHVAVNLSARQFLQADLADTIATALNDTGLAASCLKLELTETLLMQDVERTVATLQTLETMGAQIAVDDFGTGYSSLNYLKRFPLTWLKIDRSFVRDLIVDPDDAAIVSAVIALAHSLGLKVIAEGIETEAQLAFLRQRQCDAVQGFYVSRPLAADAVKDWLRNHPALATAPKRRNTAKIRSIASHRLKS